MTSGCEARNCAGMLVLVLARRGFVWAGRKRMVERKKVMKRYKDESAREEKRKEKRPREGIAPKLPSF